MISWRVEGTLGWWGCMIRECIVDVRWKIAEGALTWEWLRACEDLGCSKEGSSGRWMVVGDEVVVTENLTWVVRLVGKKCLQVQLIFYSNSFHRKMMFFVVDDADKMVIHIDKARLPKASNLTCYTHAQIHSSRHTHTSMHTHTLALSHTHTYKCWSIPHGQATRVPQSLNKERHLTILFQCSHKCFILMEMPDSL